MKIKIYQIRNLLRAYFRYLALADDPGIGYPKVTAHERAAEYGTLIGVVNYESDPYIDRYEDVEQAIAQLEPRQVSILTVFYKQRGTAFIKAQRLGFSNKSTLYYHLDQIHERLGKILKII